MYMCVCELGADLSWVEVVRLVNMSIQEAVEESELQLCGHFIVAISFPAPLREYWRWECGCGLILGGRVMQRGNP